MNYYHYTKGCHLAKIVNTGMIKTTKCGIEKKEKPAAWLTKSPEWEVACNVGTITNSQGLTTGQVYSSNDVDTVTASLDYMKKEIGMCRILISEKLPTVSWAKFKHVSRISANGYSALDKSSRDNGSPVDEWVSTFSGIPSKYWEGIEMYVDDQWVRWDGKVPIQEFVDLCLNCNGKQDEIEEKTEVEEETHNNGFSMEHSQKQIDYLNLHREEIAEFWEKNKYKKGYVEIYVTPEYQTYSCGFKFVEKRVRKSSFKSLWQSETDNYALVHILWEATFTQYKVALNYEKVGDNSLAN